jgi:hypothetical protein
VRILFSKAIDRLEGVSTLPHMVPFVLPRCIAPCSESAPIFEMVDPFDKSCYAHLTLLTVA